MSCTENECRSFVVFFLPAIVGCLTILLARRWATAQVNNSTSSTAVSRRRKIIKDPWVKRSLPQIASKMPPIGSKKAAGVSKKGTIQLLEDDITSVVKKGRTPRIPAASNPGVTLPEVKLVEAPTPPKHIPFPYIPQDGELLFEAMTFVFILVATGLQFLNLYRTTWWLPHSYTNQAMNFYLIDPHLVAFIVVLISRRLLLSITLATLRHTIAPKLMPHATIAARMFIMGVVLGALAWCLYFIMVKHPAIKIFYLIYPVVIYFLLFGFQCSPFLELNNSDCPLMHSCTHDPEQVRAEVEVLRQDFNLRVKKILFNSVVGAYYSSFIPCCFAQPYLYYDVYGASQQTVLVCGALLGRLSAQLLSAAHVDTAHRAALHLGQWRVDNCCIESESAPWTGSRLWGAGERAAAHGAVHVATAPATAAAPSSHHHARFYNVFANPSKLLCLLLCLQLSLVVVQLCLLFSSVPWHNFLSLIVLLFINYYTLFKMLRDYLIAWKVYKAENMIQDKNLVQQSINSN